MNETIGTAFGTWALLLNLSMLTCRPMIISAYCLHTRYCIDAEERPSFGISCRVIASCSYHFHLVDFEISDCRAIRLHFSNRRSLSWSRESHRSCL